MSPRWVRNHILRLPAGCALWREIEKTERWSLTLEALITQRLAVITTQNRAMAAAAWPKGKQPEFPGPDLSWPWSTTEQEPQAMDGLALARQLQALAG